MDLKKSIALTLCLLLMSALIPSTIWANVTPLRSLETVEELLYGQAQTGSLLDRIEKVELDIYGKTQEGAVLMRIDRVLTFLQDADGDGGLWLQLNLAEWGFSATPVSYTHLDVYKRQTLGGTVEQTIPKAEGEEITHSFGYKAGLTVSF